MSRTRHHGGADRLWKKYWDLKYPIGDPWHYLAAPTAEPFKMPNWAQYDYSRGPSWHTRLFSNIHKRREAKHLCHIAIHLSDEADNLIFPLDKKPYEYYW